MAKTDRIENAVSRIEEALARIARIAEDHAAAQARGAQWRHRHDDLRAAVSSQIGRLDDLIAELDR